MMDGRVGALRAALDEQGLSETPIVAYSAKFASAFYGPFREAADSAPVTGDRRGYQMDPANAREAVREARLDEDEGADVLMVKPALPYLDVIRRIRDSTELPIAAYNVSGEYAMIKAAAAQNLIDERAAVLDALTIREITPIFDTRALGYSSMLVAAKVDPEVPHRAAKVINSHPGVTHNYLRNHDFNLWFTIAVERDSTLGMDGTLDVMARATGAESIRQLPTLKLFKIRMDLEMEGGTDALKTAGEAVEPMELDPIELSDADIE